MDSNMQLLDLDTVYYVGFFKIFTENKNQAFSVLPFQYPLLFGRASTYTSKLSGEM